MVSVQSSLSVNYIIKFDNRSQESGNESQFMMILDVLMELPLPFHTHMHTYTHTHTLTHTGCDSPGRVHGGRSHEWSSKVCHQDNQR